MVQTRKSLSATKASTNSSATSTKVTPYLSNDDSVQLETPDASDDEPLHTKIAASAEQPVSTPVLTKTRAKRPAESSDELEGVDSMKPVAKRRMISTEFYVEIPGYAHKNKVKSIDYRVALLR